MEIVSYAWMCLGRSEPTSSPAAARIGSTRCAILGKAVARGELKNQDRHWSRHAVGYEEMFLDPYAPGVENPLWAALDAIPDARSRTVADLGCGTGPLLPHLAGRFGRVLALDFAGGMLERARERIAPGARERVTFLSRPMHDLDDLVGQVDVAIAVNSLVMPEIRLIDRTLCAIRASLVPGGQFLGILPSIDALAYHAMLLVDRALEKGMSAREAERLAADQIERRYYDFAFGRFRLQGLSQKFWQPFEIEHRFARAGFSSVTLSKVLYPWDESLASADELAEFPRSWDWFFLAR